MVGFGQGPTGAACDGRVVVARAEEGVGRVEGVGFVSRFRSFRLAFGPGTGLFNGLLLA